MASSRERQDAAIRAQYYRSKQRSPEAQITAERLENAGRASISESERLRKWNQGKDPALGRISAAERALASGGFSTVDVDPQKRREIVQAGVEAKLPDWLPSDVADRLAARQDALGSKLVDVEKEQAEFSRMAGAEAPSGLGSGIGETKSPRTRRKEVMANLATADDFWSKVSSNIGPAEVAKRRLEGGARDAEGMVVDSERKARIAEVLATPSENMSEERKKRIASIMAEKGVSSREAIKQEAEEYGAESAQKFFTDVEAARQDYAVGQRAKRDANRRLSIVRQQLRSPKLTQEQYEALTDEENLLEADVNLQEIGSDKQISSLGREAGKRASERVLESRRLREAQLEAAKGEAAKAKAGARTAQVIEDLMKNLYPNFGGSR